MAGEVVKKEQTAVKEKTVYKLEEIPGSIKSVVKSDAFSTAIEGFFASKQNRERFVQSAVTAITKTPALANCEKSSFFASLIQLAQFGLNPDGRNAHLIPYGKSCTLVIDYKGLVTLAYRNSKILDVHAEAVHKSDVFRKVNGHYVHEVDNPFSDRGDVIGYYAVAHLQGGGMVDEAMSVEEVNKIRERSKAKDNGPWKTDYDEMAKKTVFKRLSKWLPVTPELQAAIAKDDEEYQQDVPQFNRAGRVTAASLLNPGKDGGDGEVIDVPADGAGEAEEK